MLEFAYNNAKNVSTSYISFKLNYGLYLYIFFKKNINLYLRFCLVNKLAKKLKNLISIY